MINSQIGYIICESDFSASTKLTPKRINGKLVAEAILQTADEKNRNGRYYAEEELFPQLTAKRTLELLNAGYLRAECGHPLSKDLQRQSTIDDTRTCARFLKLWTEGKNVMAHVVGTNSPLGQAFNADLEEGCMPAWSLRALGSVNNTPRGAEVKNLRLITWDNVIYPSHPGAYTKGLVTESVEFSKPSNIQRVLQESMELSINEQLESDRISKSGILIPIKNNDVMNFLQQESGNLKFVKECFDFAYSGIETNNNGTKVLLTTNAGDTLVINTESYVHNQLMNYAEDFGIKECYDEPVFDCKSIFDMGVQLEDVDSDYLDDVLYEEDSIGRKIHKAFSKSTQVFDADGKKAGKAYDYVNGKLVLDPKKVVAGAGAAAGATVAGIAAGKAIKNNMDTKRSQDYGYQNESYLYEGLSDAKNIIQKNLSKKDITKQVGKAALGSAALGGAMYAGKKAMQNNGLAPFDYDEKDNDLLENVELEDVESLEEYKPMTDAEIKKAAKKIKWEPKWYDKNALKGNLTNKDIAKNIGTAAAVGAAGVVGGYAAKKTIKAINDKIEKKKEENEAKNESFFDDAVDDAIDNVYVNEFVKFKDLTDEQKRNIVRAGMVAGSSAIGAKVASAAINGIENKNQKKKNKDESQNENFYDWF